MSEQDIPVTNEAASADRAGTDIVLCEHNGQQEQMTRTACDALYGKVISVISNGPHAASGVQPQGAGSEVAQD